MADPFAKFYNTGTWGTLALNVLSGTALVVAATWFSYNLFKAQNDEIAPRVINSITLEPSTLPAGRSFDVKANVTLNRLCPYEVHWSLIRQSDGVEVVKVIEPLKQPPAVLGTQDLVSSERLVPASVRPGEYKYMSEVFDRCPGGKTFTSVRHDAPVTVR